MDHTVRTCARPPQIVRRPREVPLSPLRGVTPTNAAICWRVRGLNSGSSRSTVRAHTGQRPLARGTISSFARHRGLAQRVVSRSLSRVAMSALHHVIGATLSCLRRALVPARRFCSAVRMPISGWRRPHRARSAWVWASGSGRGIGRIPLAQCARARVSHASVCTNWPWPGQYPAPDAGAQRPRGDLPRPRRSSRRAPGPRWLLVQLEYDGGSALGPRASASPSSHWHRSGRPTVPQRVAGPCPTGLWPHPSQQNRARHSYALLSARPCAYGLHGTKHLYGLWESRT